MFRPFGALASLLVLLGCSGDDLTLAIDLRTDFAGGIEFTMVRTRLEGFGIQEREHVAERGLPYLAGQRIAEFDGLLPGRRTILVELLDATGGTIADRTVRLDQRSNFGLTVLVTRDCANVTCPGAGDDPSLDTCIGGVCAEATCSERDRSSCPVAECMADSDCTPAAACATGQCASGVCVFARDDAMCGAGEYCNPERGCRPESGGSGVDCAPVALRDIGSPTAVVGDGTPASCTEDAVRAAVVMGGVVTFDCGATPHTIAVTSEISLGTEELTIDGEDLITFDGGETSRILHRDGDDADPSPRLTLQRLAFTGGASVDGSHAVRIVGGSLEVMECRFLDNRNSADETYGGGALSFDSEGSGIVARSQFIDNLSSSAVLNVGSDTSITIIESEFTGNTSSGVGGAVGSSGGGAAIEVCGSEFRSNVGRYGGGVGISALSSGQSVRVSASHFEDNDTVDGSGAGIYAYEASGVFVETTTFYANRGSGIVALYSDMFVAEGRVEVTNSTFVDNVAESGNGAAMGLDPDVDGLIAHCTFVGNRALSAMSVGGAIFTPGGSPAITLRNSVFVGNESGLFPHNCNQEFVDGGGNIEISASVRLCTETARYEDPQLGTLADNGGPTLTVAPLPGSPAYGAGVDCLPTDQRGMPRSSPCTSGAVE